VVAAQDLAELRRLDRVGGAAEAAPAGQMPGEPYDDPVAQS
jgi:hypothetical protein